MVLTGKRITLKIFEDDELDFFAQLNMSPNMMTYVYDPFTFEQSKTNFENRQREWSIDSDLWYSMCITDSKTDEKLGSVGLKVLNTEAGIAEIGFMIKETAQGKGYGSEALILIRDCAFSQLGLNKLTAICAVQNTGSYKLLEKAGFEREGCLKQNAVINQQFVDDYIYGICKTL
jgi:ribosomal-protein-alanine N-acetyltransferase